MLSALPVFSVSLTQKGRDRQSDQSWDRFKGSARGQTSERRGGAHIDFPERVDTILNCTELIQGLTSSLSVCLSVCRLHA